MQLFKSKKSLLFLGLIILFGLLLKQYLLFTEVKGFLLGDPYEYASMAYKVVFNNKWEAWGIRSWFYSFFLMIPLMIMKWLKVLPGRFFMNMLIETQIIFSVSCLIVTYFIGKKINNTFTGIISVFFLTLNTLFNRWSLSTTSDIPAVLFYLLAIYFSIPNSNKKTVSSFFGGLFMGISFGIRYQVIFSFIPICFFYLKRFKNFLYFLLGFIIVFLLIGSVDQLIYGDLFHSLIANFKYNSYVIPARDYNLISLINNKFYFNSILFYFSLIEIFLMIISLIPSFYKKNIFIIIFNFIFTFAIYYFLSLKNDRFLVLVVPLICIMSAIGLDFIKFKLIKIFKLPLASISFIGVTLIFAFFFHINKIKYIDLHPFGGMIDGVNSILKYDKTSQIVAPLYTVGREFYFGENLKVINLDSPDWNNKDLVNSILKEGKYFFVWNINSFEFKKNVLPSMRDNKYYFFRLYNKLETITDANNHVIYDHYINHIYLFKKGY